VLLTHGSDILMKSVFLQQLSVLVSRSIGESFLPEIEALRCVFASFYLNKFIIIVLECCKGPSHTNLKQLCSLQNLPQLMGF
jgi:hypothetical protein